MSTVERRTRKLIMGGAMGAAALFSSAAEPEMTGDSRIINGQNAEAGDAPYIVAINVPDGYTGSSNGEPDNWCGGALIDSNKVLTAAHCVDGYPMEIFSLTVGEIGRLDGQEAEVEEVWVHPEYESPAQGHDVAVITLDREIDAPTAELNVDPAYPAVGEHAVAFGWGKTENGEPVNELRKVTVPAVGDGDCASAYDSYDSASMLCAGYHEGGKDACEGDSGGPLVANGKIVGVVSFGNGCALENSYGVYTRVNAYSDYLISLL